jgi:predicted transcriptional regulator
MKKYISIVFTIDLMKSSLITTLLFSEKRTDLLLLLGEKPQTIEEINEKLDTNSVAILPQLKKLKEIELVTYKDRLYNLSLIGKIIVKKMEPLLRTIKLLEDNYDYWSNLRPGEIPPSFFKRMEEFVTYVPGRYHGDDTSPLYSRIKEAFNNSKQIFLVISHSHSQYPDLCIENVKKGIQISVIISQPVFEKYESKFKKELDTFYLLDRSALFVLDNNIVPPTIVVTDTMVLTCFSAKSIPDRSNHLVGFGEGAVQWGLELFEYFKVLAKPFSLEPTVPAILQELS